MLRKIRQMLKSQEGFTLVELMIVVVILGILAGIGIQQYGRVQDRAKHAADEANIKVITSAVQIYLLMEDGDDPDVSDLVSSGYLDAEPKSPFSSTEAYAIFYEENGTPGDENTMSKPIIFEVYNEDGDSGFPRGWKIEVSTP